MSGQRLCASCSELLSVEQFSSAGHGKLQSVCKECAARVSREYYAANREAIRIKNLAYRQKNKESIKSRRDAIRAANPERAREWKRRDWQKHRESNLAKYKARYVANKEAYAARSREYYLANKVKVKADIRAWQEANPDQYRAIRIATSQRRRARKESAEGTFSSSDINALLEIQRGKCAGCARNIRRNYTVDHVMPLALGGSNHPGNLQLLCMDCNCRKHAMHPDEWAARVGKLFV